MNLVAYVYSASLTKLPYMFESSDDLWQNAVPTAGELRKRVVKQKVK
jgi:hypothetical protein